MNTERRPNIWLVVLRWVALPVAPFVVMMLVALIGHAWAQTGEPIVVVGENTDAIFLLSTSVVAGIAYSFTAFNMAPRFKLASVIVMTALLVLLFASCALADAQLREKVGGFGILHWCLTMAGALGTTIYLARKSFRRRSHTGSAQS